MGDNTGLSFSGNVVTGNGNQPSSANVTDQTPEHFSGPTATNVYTGGSSPTIVGIAGGADTFGIISGLAASSIDFYTVTPGIQAAPNCSLLAVMQFDHAGTG